MSDDLTDIQIALRDRGLSSYRQHGRQIVISRQRGPAWPDRGNSFWICRLDGDWYLGTWGPSHYQVPAATSVIDLAEAFVHVGESAQTQVPAELIVRFGLTPIGYDEFERLWEQT